jgi:hypothetical protein
MSNNLVVYVLDGCALCKMLIEALDASGMRYDRKVCLDDSIECDDLEDFINCSRYPIVVGGSSNKITKVYHCVNPISKSKSKKLTEHATLVCYYDITQMITALTTIK